MTYSRSRLLCHCTSYVTTNKKLQHTVYVPRDHDGLMQTTYLQDYKITIIIYPSPRLLCRTSLNLRRNTRALTRSGRIWSSCMCSTREIWTPSQPRPCAAPRKTNPGSVASSGLPSRAETSQNSQLSLRRLKRRRGLAGKGWEMCWWSQKILVAYFNSFPRRYLYIMFSSLCKVIAIDLPGWQRTTRSRGNAERDGARWWGWQSCDDA